MIVGNMIDDLLDHAKSLHGQLKFSANLDRDRCGSRIPQVSDKIRCIDEWLRSNN